MVKTRVTGFIVFVIKFYDFLRVCFCKFFEFKNASQGCDMAAKFSLCFRAKVSKRWEYIFFWRVFFLLYALQVHSTMKALQTFQLMPSL